jgi:DNA modification methylase
VIVRPKPKAKGKYQLSFGHRRWVAFKIKNIKIPTVIRDLSDEEMVDYAWDDTFQFEAHEPEEEARLILARLEFKLSHLPEYKAFGNPIELVKAMESQRIQRIITQRRVKTDQKHAGGRPQKHATVPETLTECVEKVFAQLPVKRAIDWSTFYKHKLPLLSIPVDVREQLDKKQVVGSSSAKEAIARVENELARKMMAECVSSRERISVRVLDKQARVLNKCAEGLAKITSQKEKKRIIQLILDKCPHPKDVQLEIEKVVPREPGPESSAKEMKQKDELLDGIYVGRDSRDMHEVSSESVRLIVTSPPYFNKLEFDDYLSRCKTPDDFFRKLEPIIAECKRVLMPGGKLVINWGEPIGEDSGVDYEENILVDRWVKLCREVGLKLWAKAIWWKNPPSYSIAQDRVKLSDAIRAEGKLHLNWEWIIIFRKPGPMFKGNNELSHDDFVKYTNPVWDISGTRAGPRGLAVFPDELVARIIKLYSFKGDKVLDPFLGSGTTVKVARQLGGVGIGYEIARWLSPIIEEKLNSIKACARTHSARRYTLCRLRELDREPML